MQRLQSLREYAVSSLDAINPAWLRLSQNPATGESGTCYGDSGGPNFLGVGITKTSIIAGTTITGDALCKSTNVIYRLDLSRPAHFWAVSWSCHNCRPKLPGDEHPISPPVSFDASLPAWYDASHNNKSTMIRHMM